jgi:hypothetical protein
MTDPNQAAETLALAVWDFLSAYHHDAASVTEEDWAAIRTAAFKFSREVRPLDMWQVTYGRRLAGAVLVFADDDPPENLRALERASRKFEELRISPPDSPPGFASD